MNVFEPYQIIRLYMNSQQFCAQSIVREFTTGAANAVCDNGSATVVSYPQRPIIAQPEQVKFISKMVLSEVLEMLLTISPNVVSVKEILHELVDTLDLPSTPIPNIGNLNLASGDKNVNVDEIDVIEAQMDAVADIMYYLLDFCTKQGYNIDRIMDLVHGANMAKRHEDGKFHKRADGKVIKPKGWKEADSKTEVSNQILGGSW